MKVITISKSLAVEGATFTLRHSYTGQHWLVLNNGKSVAINNKFLVSPQALVYPSVTGYGYSETTLRATITRASVQWNGSFAELIQEIEPAPGSDIEPSVLIWHPDPATAVRNANRSCFEVESGGGLVRLLSGGSYDLELIAKESRAFREPIVHTLKTSIKFDGVHVYINSGRSCVDTTWA